eukprot:1142321-Pelagomonas_calceolata.AAC.1
MQQGKNQKSWEGPTIEQLPGCERLGKAAWTVLCRINTLLLPESDRSELNQVGIRKSTLSDIVLFLLGDLLLAFTGNNEGLMMCLRPEVAIARAALVTGRAGWMFCAVAFCFVGVAEVDTRRRRP